MAALAGGHMRRDVQNALNMKTATMGSRTPRKSCDFCYKRKIKCDDQKPRCSHCAAHSQDCTYTAPSRKLISTRRQAHADLEARFHRLEASFEQLNERLDFTESRNEVEQQIERGELRPIPEIPLFEQSARPDLNGYYPKPRGHPTLQRILPIIDSFLGTYNTLLPLFDSDELRDIVQDFYENGPSRQSPIVWAAIHVALGLSHHFALHDEGSIAYANECLRKIQSVLSSVVLGETQLLNIQVLVGAVTLLQGFQDLQPALILIGTTMRLAHKLGLHNRSSSAQLSPRSARQRACVFWVAYILDKDISIRTNSPSVQKDEDIDLDLPPPRASEHQNWDAPVGLVRSTDGTTQMNFFLARIQLAVIEGGVYDYLYSTHSQKRSSFERLGALESLRNALEQWKASVPSEFDPTAVMERLPRVLLPHFRMLHATSLSCAALMSRASSCVSTWVSRVRINAREGTVPHLTSCWQELVNEGRDLLRLFDAAPVTDSWNFWTTAGSHVTAVMILATNAMCNPQSEDDTQDGCLVDNALQVVNKIIQDTDSDKLRSYREACVELVYGARQRGGLSARTSYTIQSTNVRL